jgi:DNA repair protein RadC
MKMNIIPEESKPRERLVRNGASTLSDYELLAILLRSGNKNNSVIDIACNLLSEYKDLKGVFTQTIQELMKHDGIGQVKALEICAFYELSLRMKHVNTNKTSFLVPIDVYKFLLNKMRDWDQEQLFILYLNAKKQIISHEMMFKGTNSLMVISPQEIINKCIRHRSNRFIIAHNHPSENILPSNQDVIMTKKIKLLSEQMNLEMLDHIIFSESDFFSFKQEDMLE